MPAGEEELIEFDVRLIVTLRGEATTTVEAKSIEEACELVSKFDADDFYYDVLEGASPDGDEIAFVVESDRNGEDEVEVDLRAEGQPFSWVACEIVTDLAKLSGSGLTDALLDLVERAKQACEKEKFE